MHFELMRLQVHFRLKGTGLVIQTFLFRTQEMILPEMIFQGAIVYVVLLMPRGIPSIADEAFLVLISAMLIQLIISIKTDPAEATFRMTFEATLVHSSRVVITKLFVPSKFLMSEQLMLVSKNFLIPCAQVTQHSVMDTSDMSMEVRPSPAGNIACRFGAIISKQQDCILVNVTPLISDTQYAIRLFKVVLAELFIAPTRIIGEDDVISFRLTN